MRARRGRDSRTGDARLRSRRDSREAVQDGPGEIGVPVVIGGVSVATGDVVVADTGGVAFIPRVRLDAIISAVQKKLENVAAKRQRIRTGAR